MRLDRRPVAERRVWPLVVVIGHPRGNPRPRIGKLALCKRWPHPTFFAAL